MAHALRLAVLTLAAYPGALAEPKALLGLRLEQAMERLLLRPADCVIVRDCARTARSVMGCGPGQVYVYLYVTPVREDPDGPSVTIRQLRRERVVGVGLLKTTRWETAGWVDPTNHRIEAVPPDR